jgi:pimeloyl-ACP methyl ester carboxylesterase
VAEYETMLAHSYPAARPEAIRRMARHGVRQRPDGRFALKMDAFYRGGAERPSEAQLEERERRLAAQMWDALGKLPCPALVVRGAASDVMSADVADRMVEEVIPDARLAVVARAGHSVMTDNPEGFAEAVASFVLG